MREVAGGAFAIGLPDGDVEAAVTNGVVGAFEAARIAQFGEDRGRRHRTDAVELPDERAAAGLAAGEELQRSVDRCQLTVELVEHPQAQRDGLASSWRQVDGYERSLPGSGARLDAGWHAPGGRAALGAAAARPCADRSTSSAT